MGNRWSSITGDSLVINPPENPFLHIFPGPDKKYAYVTSVRSGLEVLLGNVSPERKAGPIQSEDFMPYCAPIIVPLLPRLEEIPPPTIVGSSRLAEVMEELFTGRNFLRQLEKNRGVNSIKITYGSQWGLSPVKNITERLAQAGYENRGTAQVGRCHRITSNVMLISRY